ncbi:hypothetical protein Tco_0174738, partial [Tanacetum coccineum]
MRVEIGLTPWPELISELSVLLKGLLSLYTLLTIQVIMLWRLKLILLKFVKSSLFGGGSSSAGGADHIIGGFFDLTGNDFIVSDDGRVCREMVDEFSLPKFFALIRGMEHDQLFIEFNVGAARQISLGAEVRMRAEYNIKEKS